MEDIPSKMSSTRNTQAWINTKVRRLLQQKQRWYRKSKQTDSPRVRNKYKDLKKTAQRECRRAHNEYVQSMVNDTETGNNKRLWSYIRGKNQEHAGIAPLAGENGVVHSDPCRKASILNDQFSSVFSDPSGSFDGNLNDSAELPELPKIIVNERGVFKLMCGLNENKACGPDSIPSKILKICASELAPVFTTLFQASLDQGVVPDDWKKANIVPIYKKGDKSKAENYRPVSLTSISCKLLEHIIHSNIMTHFDKYQALTDVQHGFRKGRSCETQLLTTIHDFAENLNEKKQIDAILLDFSKAFDKVHHQSLLLKLERFGIKGPLHDWFRSFLTDRQQKVIVEGKESSSKPVLSGVPQGTVLGPLLFLVYINDLPKRISPGTTLRLFADDSLLYRTINTTTDADILQQDLDELQKWEREWKMQFHPQKCQVLRITNKHSPISCNYFIHDQQLELTQSAKYLGLTIDSKIKWSNHINNICTKANKTLNFIRRNTYSCPQPIRETCYKTFVRPTLEYSSTVWDPKNQGDIHRLESIQRRAARYTTNCYDYNIPSETLLKNMNWIPLAERRARAKVTTFYKGRYNICQIPLNHLHSNTRRGNHMYQIPRSFVDSHLYSFFPSTVRLWNGLTAEVAGSDSLESFKTQINRQILRISY